jgi:hypothetical protein
MQVMTLSDYSLIGPSDMSFSAFAATLRMNGSPAAAEASTMYLVLTSLDVRPAPFLAFFRHESRLGTTGICKDYNLRNPGNVRTPERLSAPVVEQVETPRGQFVRYKTWYDGTADWAYRMTGPKYAGRGLTTVRQVLPIYAPARDDNDPEAYARAVLADIETLIATQVTDPFDALVDSAKSLDDLLDKLLLP